MGGAPSGRKKGSHRKASSLHKVAARQGKKRKVKVYEKKDTRPPSEKTTVLTGGQKKSGKEDSKSATGVSNLVSRPGKRKESAEKKERRGKRFFV